MREQLHLNTAQEALAYSMSLMRSEDLSILGDPTTTITLDNPVGIVVLTSGNVVGMLTHDTTDSTIYLEQGIFYPYSYQSITLSGTTATGITILG